MGANIDILVRPVGPIGVHSGTTVVPDAPVEAPEREPATEPRRPAPSPQREPFNPEWPADLPLPQPKGGTVPVERTRRGPARR